MAKIAPALSASNDLLLSNSAGVFLVLPAKQARNPKHKEKEICNPCKYNGLFWGTQKLVDSWLASIAGKELSPELQDGFLTDLVTAEKSYSPAGKKIIEEIFIPDFVPALAVSYFGEFASLDFQPELDIRDRYSSKWTDYGNTYAEHACVSSSQGFFIAMGSDAGLKPLHQYRYKFYEQDYERGDIAERWAHSPCILSGKRFFFGLGKSEREALENQERVRRDLEEMKLKKAERLNSLWSRLRTNLPGSGLATAYQLSLAQFLSIQNGAHLPASGDRWFAGDAGWLRDTMISLEAYFELGLLDQAKEIIRTWLRRENMSNEGRFAERLEPKQWSSMDGTLWLLRRFGEFCMLSKDRHFLAENIGLVQDSLGRLVESRSTEQGFLKCNPYETWMDTKFTPRDGYPIEVQSLFIHDCRLLSPLLEEKFASKLLRISTSAFNSLSQFKCSEKANGTGRKYLADHISPTHSKSAFLTPNQLIAIDCGVVEPEMQADILSLSREKLAGKGVRTLAQGEISYFDKHVGDYSYHRGPQWPFLNMFAAKAEIRSGSPQNALKFYLQPLVEGVISQNPGGVSELYNGDGSNALVPHYQTWSLASFIVMCREYGRATSANR